MSSRIANNNNKRKEQQNNVVVSSKKGRRAIVEEEPEESQEPDQTTTTEDFPMTQAPTEEQAEEQQVEGGEEEPPLLESMEPETPADQPVQEREPQSPVKAAAAEVQRTDNAEMNRNLLDEFNQAAEPDDALMLAALDQVENKKEEDAKAMDIFDTAREYDYWNHNNLHFENPRLASAVFSFEIQQGKGKFAGRKFENFRTIFQDDKVFQRFDDKNFFKTVFIAPPGKIENFNPPPFGNLDELEHPPALYPPKTELDCKMSYTYTSSLFYHNSDRDDIEYDKRTRRLYKELKVRQAKAKYKEEHKEIKLDSAIPKDVYNKFNENSPLNAIQLNELEARERFSYNSMKVTSWFKFVKSNIEDMYRGLLTSDCGKNCETLRDSVINSINNEKVRLQRERENKAEKFNKDNAKAIEAGDKEEMVVEEVEPEAFDDVLQRKIKSLLKEDFATGTWKLGQKKNLFRKATDKEKKELESGILRGSNAKITEICKAKGLVEEPYPIYRWLTEEEKRTNPDADPLVKMSVGEAYKLIQKCDYNIIGQPIVAPSPLFVSGEQMIYYGAIGLIFWGPADMFREARQFKKNLVAPVIEKRIYASLPVINSGGEGDQLQTKLDSKDLDDFNNMAIPKVKKFEKKEEKKEGEAPAAK